MPNNKTCTWKGCDKPRVLTFQYKWNLLRSAIPNYIGLSSSSYSIAPCIEHLEKCDEHVMAGDFAEIASEARRIFKEIEEAKAAS